MASRCGRRIQPPKTLLYPEEQVSFLILRRVSIPTPPGCVVHALPSVPGCPPLFTLVQAGLGTSVKSGGSLGPRVVLPMCHLGENVMLKCLFIRSRHPPRRQNQRNRNQRPRYLYAHISSYSGLSLTKDLDICTYTSQAITLV